MKNQSIVFMFSIALMLSSGRLAAQVAINADGAIPDNSAILEVKSTSSGLLIPRMTLDQRNAIATPAEGLMVFCTDCGSRGSLSVYSDGSWSTFAPCITPAPGATTNTVTPGQITWNWMATLDAIGYKWGTTSSYTAATDMANALFKTETGIICDSTYTRYLWSYNACGHSTPVTLTQSALDCSWLCGDPITISHITGEVAPVDKTVTYGTVTNIPGETTKCWITRNLGASQQATAVSDNTEASAGWYWQFNRKQGYQYISSRIPVTAWISSINETSNWFTANDPCTIELGSEWRIPTYTELNNVDNTGGWTDWTGPWNSALKLHAAGSLYYSNGTLFSRGAYGRCWSSTQNDADNGWYLTFNSSTSLMNANNKASGFTLRCLRDN